MRTPDVVVKSYNKTASSRFPTTCVHIITSHFWFCESTPSDTYASSLYIHYEQTELQPR